VFVFVVVVVVVVFCLLCVLSIVEYNNICLLNLCYYPGF